MEKEGKEKGSRSALHRIGEESSAEGIENKFSSLQGMRRVRGKGDGG